MIAAAQALLVALVHADTDALRGLLGPDFRAVDGEDELGREAYIKASTRGYRRWRRLELEDPVVTVVGDTAVLFATMTRQREGTPPNECIRRRVTQTWARDVDGWRCLTGYAGALVT